jgi:hypothetical protein
MSFYFIEVATHTPLIQALPLKMDILFGGVIARNSWCGKSESRSYRNSRCEQFKYPEFTIPRKIPISGVKDSSSAEGPLT